MKLPPMPDEFISSQEWLHRRLTDGRWAHKIATADAPPFWREFRNETPWEAELAWASSCAEAAYEKSKAEHNLVGRRVVFTPEGVVRGKPNATISGIAFYRLESWQRYEDDQWSLPVQMLTCSALAEEGVYLSHIDSDKRSHFFYVPDKFVSFVGLSTEDAMHLRSKWLAQKKAEPHAPFVGKTTVRRSVTLRVSPYESGVVTLRVGDEVEISERYHAPFVFPGTTTDGTKHFDVKTKDGVVVRSVQYEVLSVNGGWPSPDLPYAGPTIIDECRVQF